MKSNNFAFQRLDSLRGFIQGILEIGFSVFVLLIAIRWWDASSVYKGFLVGGISIGLLLTPFFNTFLHRFKYSEPQIASMLMLIVGVCLLLAAITHTLFVFISVNIIAQICLSQLPNMMLRVYAGIYDASLRGRKVSLTLALSTVGGLIASYAFGSYLDLENADYRWVFLWMGSAALFSSYLFWKMRQFYSQIPSSLEVEEKGKPFSILMKDRSFLKVLIAWMLLGFGAIMTFPLRIEFLSRETAMNLSNQQIALVAVVAFFSAKILSTFFWGRMFDEMHFIKLRVILNIIMATAILIYFNCQSLIGVLLGSVLAGIGMGGASLAWNLWVTKLAPTDKVKDYMSIHMSFTGVRGFFAPFAGYWVESMIGFDGVSILSATMIILSGLIFMNCIAEKRFCVSK